MTNYPELQDMTKKDWLSLINDGVNKGLVKVVDSDKLDKDYGTQGIVCNIGNDVFYYFENADEYDDEDSNGLERFMNDFSQEEINEQIVNQLLSMQEEYIANTDFENNELCDKFDIEYSYCYNYLVENL